MKKILLRMPDDEHLQAAHLAYERCTRFHLFVPESKFWHELAEVYFHYRAYEGSMDVLVHITRDDPKYDHLGDVIFMCGIMYYRLKKYKESIECLKKVLHSPPKGWKERNILFLLARLHNLNGEDVFSNQSYEEVYDFVRKKNLQVSEEQRSRVHSTRDYVQDPDTWYRESCLYARSGYYELAEDALNMALKYSYDVDAKLGVPNYSREKLKEIWVRLCFVVVVVVGCFFLFFESNI
jgi:tetratricopeptide (TPR) repeat protein